MAEQAQSDGDWRLPHYREKVVTRIEDAMRQAGNTTNRSGADIERHMFSKANSREDYLAYVARIILHINKSGGGGQGGPGMGGQGGGGMGGPPGLTDPINALTTLTAGPSLGPPRQGQPQPGAGGGVGGPMGMQPRAPFVSYQPQQPGGHMQRGPPMHPQMQQPMPGHMQAQMGNQMGQQMGGQMVSQMGNQMAGQQMQGGSYIIQQQPQQHPVSMQQQMAQHPGMQYKVATAYGGQQQHQQQQQQQQQQQPQPNSMQPNTMQANSIQPNSQLPTSQPQQIQQQQQQIQQQQQPSQGFHVPSPMGTVVSQPSPLGMVPQPSPGSLMPQQSPMGPSPLSVAMSGAPSPGQMNTPGNPYSVGSLTSPAGASMRSEDPDEKKYLAKVKELQKYIEPLKRMIRRIENEDDRKKDQSKLKNLLDILQDTKRMQFPALLKCEEVLKKLSSEFQKYPDKTSSGSTAGTMTSSVTSLPKTGGPMCQALFNSVVSAIKSPVINHSLHRSFGPAVKAINGTHSRTSSPPRKRTRRFSTSPPRDIPRALQGEIARLHHSFTITLQHNNAAPATQLLCEIASDNHLLPSVPPITLTIPENYPKESPTWEPMQQDYDSTAFLQRVEKNLTSQVVQLGDLFSVTALLNTWEMSIRKACAPPSAASL